MTQKLLLIDLENKHKVDLSPLDDSFRAIIFVGANQGPPKAAKNPATAHRFQRVDFLKISGAGKNALDFHIAFELGRTFQAAPETLCFVLSGDKGFDPLLHHLNSSGMRCRRVDSIDDLLLLGALSSDAAVSDGVACAHCGKSSTVEHYGGHWCSNCGRFASPPDPTLLPSSQLERRADQPQTRNPFMAMRQAEHARASLPWCGWCHQQMDMTGGIYDDGEWMCGDCINRLATS